MKMKSWLMSGAFGAAIAYFLDPNSGARRRNITRDKLLATGRKLGRRAERTARYAEGEAFGTVERIVPHKHDNPNPDARTLKDRVESEILRDPKIKEADVVFDAPGDGIIELRGVLSTEADIQDLMQRVGGIDGVKEVVSYLHLPGSPAPNKTEAMRVSEMVKT